MEDEKTVQPEPRQHQVINNEFIQTMAVLGEKQFSILKLHKVVEDLRKKGDLLLLEAQASQLHYAKKEQEGGQ